jgi:hypothetical protein
MSVSSVLAKSVMRGVAPSAPRRGRFPIWISAAHVKQDRATQQGSTAAKTAATTGTAAARPGATTGRIYMIRASESACGTIYTIRASESACDVARDYGFGVGLAIAAILVADMAS